MALRATIGSVLFLLVLLIQGALQAEQRGILKVSDRCSVALDEGTVQCVVPVANEDADSKQHPVGKNWDFWLQVSGKGVFLNPLNRTMFAKVTGEASCHGAMYKRDRFRIDAAGARVCVLTGQRKYAELTLESPAKSPGEPLVFSYLLRE